MEEEKKDKQELGKQVDKNSRPKFSSNWIFAIIALSILLFQIIYGGRTTEKITTRDLREMLVAREVEKIIVVNKDNAEIYLNQKGLESEKHAKVAKRSGTTGFSAPKPHYIYTIGDLNRFETLVIDTQKEAGYEEKDLIYPEHITRKNYLVDILGWMLPFVALLLLWLFIMKRMTSGAGGGAGGIFSVGKSRAQVFDKDTSVKVNFSDVAGLEEAKTEVMEIVDFLKNPKKYTQLGGKIPKGALLIGPPGTGKTLLAKAVAGEANVPFFSISGSEFVEMFVGVGASRVRDLFKQAKERAPCIVFIDEIDAVGRARGRNPNFGANDERENTLNQLLTEMDGFASNMGVIILAATNRADVLDRALLRAGRFDRQIHVELPDLKEREAIFKVHMRPLKLEKELDISFLAKQTPGFSGADIANVCNEAALIAARRNKNTVEKQDFLDAIDRIVGGLEKKNKIISFDEKRTIAYHEAGHALVSWLLEHASPLVKVTIIPRGKALGAAWYLPEERQLTTREQILDEMAYAMGGRAAEQLIFGKISTGALSDLEKVTKQAYAMVAYFGMSEEIGNISFYDSTGQAEFNFTKPYSEKTAELIDREVKKIVDEAYSRATDILKNYKECLIKVAELLLDKEVIYAEDLEKILGKRKKDTARMTQEEGKKEQSGEKPDNETIATTAEEPAVAELCGELKKSDVSDKVKRTEKKNTGNSSGKTKKTGKKKNNGEGVGQSL